MDYGDRYLAGLFLCFIHAHPCGRRRAHGESRIPRGHGPQATILAWPLLKRIVRMRVRIFGLLSFLLLGAASTNGQPAEDPATPAFTNVPELMAGFRLLNIQRYPQARTAFAAWESQHRSEEHTSELQSPYVIS